LNGNSNIVTKFVRSELFHNYAHLQAINTKVDVVIVTLKQYWPWCGLYKEKSR